MKKYLIAAIAFMPLSCFAKHHYPHIDTIEGKYACHGTEPGSQKTFTCEKTMKKTGDTYASTTVCDDGSANKGTGIYDKTTHRLALAFIDTKKPNESGVAIEEIMSNGSIAITYAYLNTNTKGYATCKKQ